jgi:Icc-related predicted phosphoesterase
MKVRIVAISDTHEMHRKIAVPDGDILIHAGDATLNGRLTAINEFNAWLGTLSHAHKIVVAGNHDWGFQRQPAQARALMTNAVYLQDTTVTIEGLKIYGSPWQPWFYDWAFNLRRGSEIAARWELIPADTEVLVTHGPPYGFHDLTPQGRAVGCQDLLRRIEEIKPRLHIFGHIHNGYGMSMASGTTFINASICDEQYRPCNAPIVYDMEV